MKALPAQPSLYQINTRVWLTGLSRTLGKRAFTLDDIPDAELDRLAEMGFDWIWLLSVWAMGPAGQRVSRDNHEWRREFAETLPDLREEDIVGSGFAITGWNSLTADYLLFYAIRSFATAGGDCSNVHPPGKVTGPGIASWPLPGKTPMETGWW